MKTIQPLAAGLFKVGRVTPCAPRLNDAETARRGLTRPTTPRPRSALLLRTFVLTAATLLLRCPASAHAQGGVPLWTNHYIPKGGSIGTYSKKILVGRTGNIFLQYGLVAFSSDGVLLWTQDRGSGAIALDSSDNVIATGSNAAGYETVKYSLAVVQLWTNTYVHGTNWGFGSAIAVDKNDNVFVTGTSSSHYGTVAYSSSCRGCLQRGTQSFRSAGRRPGRASRPHYHSI